MENLLVELTFWACDLRRPLPTIAPPRGIELCGAGPDELPALLAAVGPERRDAILQRLAKGRRAYIALRKGAVVAYGWATFADEHIGDLERDIQLAPGEAYIFDCLTLPAYRKRGLYVALLRGILQALRDEGLTRAWIGAIADNMISRRGIARAGFTHVADLVYQRMEEEALLLVVPRRKSTPEQLEAVAQALDGQIARARASVTY